MQSAGVDNVGDVCSVRSVRSVSDVSDTDSKEIIRRLVEAANNYDMATISALVAPNAISHMLYDATEPLTGQALGREEEFDPDRLEKRVAYERGLYVEQHTRIDQIFDVGADMVLSICTYTASTRVAGSCLYSRLRWTG